MIKNYFHIVKTYLKLKVFDKKLMAWLCVVYTISTLISLCLPFLAAKIIEYITVNNYIVAIEFTCYLGIAFILNYIFLKACYVIYQKNYIYTYFKMQEKVIDKVSIFDEQFTNRFSKSYLINTISRDIMETAGLFDGAFDFLCNLLELTVTFIILASVNIILAVIVICLSFLYLTLDAKRTKKRDDALSYQRKYQDKITNLLNQIITGNKEVRTFQMGEKLNKHFQSMKKDWTRVYITKRKHYDHKEAILPAYLNFGEIILYVILIVLLIKQHITLAIVVLIVGYYKNVYQNCQNLNDFYTSLSGNMVRIHRLIKIFDYQPHHQLTFGDNMTDDIFGNIEFEQVSFSYQKELILNDISFQIIPNTLTAIVGKSGSGKSTIFKLLLRLAQQDKGSIYIDGIDIYEYSKEVYSSNISIATQQPFLFNMSIQENFNLVDNDFDHQVEACKMVGIHDFIMSLPKQYKTVLEENAHNISGGQKQLLALARTLLSKAEILLFDEITASLDPRTTKHIITVLQKLKKNHTILLITHKPIVMKKVDKLIMIHKGKIVGMGKHRQLLNNKYYQQLQK